MINSHVKMVNSLLMQAFAFDLYLKNGSFSSVFVAICNGKSCFASLTLFYSNRLPKINTFCYCCLYQFV